MRAQLADSKHFRVRGLESLHKLSEASKPLAANKGEHLVDQHPPTTATLPSLPMTLCSFCVSHSNCIHRVKRLKIHKICFQFPF